MANESLLITLLPDGTYHVKETEAPGEDDPDPAIDQSVKSPDEVTQLVQQWLGVETDEPEDVANGGANESAEGETPEAPAGGADMKAAWNQEAATRDVSGYRN